MFTKSDVCEGGRKVADREVELGAKGEVGESGRE